MDATRPRSDAIPSAAALAVASPAAPAQELTEQDSRVWKVAKAVFSVVIFSIAVAVRVGVVPGLLVAGALGVALYFLSRSQAKADEEKAKSSFQIVKALLANDPVKAQGFLDRWDTLSHDVRDPHGVENLKMAYTEAKKRDFRDLMRQLIAKLKSIPNSNFDSRFELMTAIEGGDPFLTQLALKSWTFESDFISGRFLEATEKHPTLVPLFLESCAAQISEEGILRAMGAAVQQETAVSIFKACFPHQRNILHHRSAMAFLMTCCKKNWVALMGEMIKNPLPDQSMAYICLMFSESFTKVMFPEMTQCIEQWLAGRLQADPGCRDRLLNPDNDWRGINDKGLGVLRASMERCAKLSVSAAASQSDDKSPL